MERRRDDLVSTAQETIPDTWPGSEALSARAVAALLGVHERTVRRAIREGRLVATKRGRAFSITPEALHHYRDAQSEWDRVEPAPARPRLTLLPGRGRRAAERPPPTAASGQSTAAGFPRLLTSLVGREREIVAITALLTSGTRLLTLTGPGGVGKTRLAIAAATALASRFADGAVFVPLTPVTDPALVLPAIAQALDVSEIPGRPLATTLAAALRQRRLLLVLDNFERVQGAAAEVVDLLEDCPGLTVLLTSRAPLHVGVEQRYLAPPLALPGPGDAPPRDALAGYGAIALFVERARAVKHDFVLDLDNEAVIVEICRRLDGLPLAIELAAPWVRVMSPGALLARLEHRLPLLHGGGEERPARLRTMRDAIAWSYDLLTPDEARCYRHLAVFVGGCPLEACEWVAGDGWRVAGADPDTRHPSPATRHRESATLELLASLIDKSLLWRSETGDEPRIQMLETIREFALERLAESDEADAIAARHAAWCVGLAESVRQAGGLSQRRGLAVLEAEHPNLRAALAWLLESGETPPSGGDSSPWQGETPLPTGRGLGEGHREGEQGYGGETPPSGGGGHGGKATTALHLAGDLAEFWMRHGHWSEGTAWLERALAADDGEPTAERAEALVGLSMLLWPRDDFARAAEFLDEAEATARAAGNAGAVAYTRLHQGYVAAFRGDLDLAVARGEEALTTCAAIPQKFSCNGALWLLARATLERGEDDRAADCYERLLASARAGGDEISLSNGLYGLAILAEHRGDLGRALAGFAEAAAVGRDREQHLDASLALDAAAAVVVALGRPEAAVRQFAAADALRMAIGAAPVLTIQVDRQHHMQALAAARDALGAGRFDAVWAAGLALSLDGAVAEATALAREVTSPAQDHPAPLTAGMTEREREVLCLLVTGLTDKEIAAALYISPRTASSHVAAIRAKVGAPSRAAAAAIAVRDRLV